MDIYGFLPYGHQTCKVNLTPYLGLEMLLTAVLTAGVLTADVAVLIEGGAIS